MDVRPILNPLPGETLAAVAPALSPEPEVSWNRRLHLHSGRALSDVALTTEQNERAGRLALAGQLLAQGVVTGLEAGLEQSTDANGALQVFFHVGAGIGLAASGEMVNIPTPLRMASLSTPVYAPAALLDGDEAPEEGAEVVRRLGPSLGQAIAQGLPLPRAGILLLQPVTARVVGRAAAADPCEIDPTANAFDDRQWVDGCRLVFFAWPTDLLALPDAGAAWRNRIAYAIFERERGFDENRLWPWEAVGVPVGLVALDEAMQPFFLDRYAVVRTGGKARRRRPLLAGGGSPQLWQARIQQFAEEMTELTPLNLPPAEVAAHFHYLPPVGILPSQSLDFTTRTDRFFTPNDRVTARPAPIEQLDLVLRESAPLAPLHRGIPAQIEVVVPVPQQWYDPNLLNQDAVSPEFAETIEAFSTRRAEWLARRRAIRRIASALNRALKGKPILDPTPDPDALEPDEPVQEGELTPPEAGYGTRVSIGIEGPIVDPAGNPLLEVIAVEELRQFLRSNATPLKEDEVNRLPELGLEGFIDFLDDKVRRANDTVDLSFLRVQTDIYRVRQRILGAQEATRLATSPVLAAIAKGESAYATRQDLDTFLAGIKATQPQGIPAPEAASEPAGDVAPQQAAPAIGVIGADRFVGGSSALTNIIRTGPQLEAIDVGLSRGTVGVSQNLLEGLVQSPAKSARDFLESEAVVLRPPTKEDILDQAPIVGQIYDFRTVAIAERIAEPPSGESRSAAIATKHTTITAVQEIGINLDDVQVPGFQDVQGNQVSRSLQDVGGELLGEILRGVHDPVPAGDRNEATFFNASVKALENTVAVLRGVEGRVKAYRNVVERCREVLATVRTLAADTERRLKAVGDEVAEARHDVAVARALLAEEQQRIDAINTRRATILRDEVPFLVYRRPRVAQLVVQTPARAIDPGFAQPPVAACKARNGVTPPELQQMVDLMRRAPIRWFVDMLPLLDQLDQPQTLIATLQSARLAALTRQSPQTLAVAPFATTTTLSTTRATAFPSANLAGAIGKVFATQQQSVAQVQMVAASLNLSEFVSQSWQYTRDRARDVVSVGDLIDGAHGRSAVAQSAAGALDDIAQVATCLYEEFSAVPPLVRLAWAELLSQYDAPVSLRNLASLPRWDEVEEVLDRREMQMLVDWLYARVDPREADAVGLIGDLIRVGILLASHAPVNQIIAGALHEAVTVKPGGQIKIVVDPIRVRIGMPVFVYRNQEVVAQAVVSDLNGGLASARVTQMAQASLQLDKGSRVQFAEAFR